MSIDVVIPTYKNISEKNFSIFYTLRSILNQSLQPQRIIVIENGDFELMQHKIENCFGKLVSVLDGTSKNQNISFARNLGVSAGDSEIIIFLDDDVVIGKSDFFYDISIKMNSLDFYCGALRYWTTPDWSTYLDHSYPISHIRNILKFKSYLPKSIERFTGRPSFHEFSFIGHFGSIKRKAFVEINGFDENFKGWSYQDTDLMMRLCKAGYNYDLMHCDNIFIYHLAHGADKSFYLEANRILYNQIQAKLGVKFRLNHFFGIFDDDCYSIFD